jgi:segregation and condensation protein A
VPAAEPPVAAGNGEAETVPGTGTGMPAARSAGEPATAGPGTGDGTAAQAATDATDATTVGTAASATAGTAASGEEVDTGGAATDAALAEAAIDMLGLAEGTIEPTPPQDAAMETLEGGAAGFRVTLANFAGPFDLLLQLIGKHKLDVTEVALHTVTDDFIAYIRAMGQDWDLDEVSEFLVVASTLLDLKAARLLPAAAVEDEGDLALLEARDLLFARLLQYKAYKEAAGVIARLEAVGSRRYPRAVGLEPRFADALPDLVLGIGPQRLAALAAKAMTPKTPPVVSTDHVHLVRVSVREHAAILRERLIRAGTATFRSLCSDCESTLEVVARFLALLELYQENLVGFDQIDPLGELTVRWIGGEVVSDFHIDEYAGGQRDIAEDGDGSALAETDNGGDASVQRGREEDRS